MEPPQPAKLLDQVRNVMRLKHRVASPCGTIPSALKKPTRTGSGATSCSMASATLKIWALPKSRPFSPTWLWMRTLRPRRTCGQALCALEFLYREVLRQELDGSLTPVRAKKPQRLPTVLTKEEARRVIGLMSGAHQLMAKLLYGSGLRLMECVRLRVKDIDFAQHQIIVRDGKGGKDRITMLPDAIVPALQEHLQRVKLLHESDLAHGNGSVYLPYALERKYPNASKEWLWQYVFPSDRLSVDPRSDVTRRHTCTCP
jgi:integrase